jgi:hypothetical protein
VSHSLGVVARRPCSILLPGTAKLIEAKEIIGDIADEYEPPEPEPMRRIDPHTLEIDALRSPCRCAQRVLPEALVQRSRERRWPIVSASV